MAKEGLRTLVVGKKNLNSKLLPLALLFYHVYVCNLFQQCSNMAKEGLRILAVGRKNLTANDSVSFIVLPYLCSCDFIPMV